MSSNFSGNIFEVSPIVAIGYSYNTFAENSEKFPGLYGETPVVGVKSSFSFGLLLFQVQPDD